MGWGRGHARLAPLVVDVVAVAAVLDADAAPLVVLAVEGVLVVAVAALLVADVQRAVAGVVAARHHLFRQQRTRSSVAAALLTRDRRSSAALVTPGNQRGNWVWPCEKRGRCDGATQINGGLFSLKPATCRSMQFLIQSCVAVGLSRRSQPY